MAVTLISQVTKRFIGLAADAKPTDVSVPVGSLFYCTDTPAVWIYDGTAWQNGTGNVLFQVR